MPPYGLSGKKGDRWFIVYAKIAVQICIFALGWALQSPQQTCESF